MNLRSAPHRVHRRVSALLFGLMAGFSSAGMSATLHGAGATFPAPLYQRWGKDYERYAAIALEYAATDSAAGIASVRARGVDFGATDAPLDSATLTQAELQQFPAAIGAVVPVVNIAGVKPGSLRLNGALLADIYLGRVRRWDDAAIAALNPDLRLPHANITVVHRSDASGTSLLFTRLLAANSAPWSTHVGTSLAPIWPVGVGGIGNEGVASYVQRTRLSIGYVEYAYAIAHHLSDTRLRNHDGLYVSANLESFQAALGSWGDGDVSAQLPVDRPGAAAWPLIGISFVLVSARSVDADSTRRVVDFFAWALRAETGATHALGYIAMPEVARAHGVERLRRDEATSAPLIR